MDEITGKLFVSLRIPSWNTCAYCRNTLHNVNLTVFVIVVEIHGPIQYTHLKYQWHTLVDAQPMNPNSKPKTLHQLPCHEAWPAVSLVILNSMKSSIFYPLRQQLVQCQHKILCMPFSKLVVKIERISLFWAKLRKGFAIQILTG